MPDSTDTRWLVVLVAVGPVLLAGCLSGFGPASSPTQSPDEAAGSTATPPPTEPPQAAALGCPETLSFYRLGDHAAWSPEEVTVGFYSPGNASAFFVVLENDRILGTEQWSEDRGVHVDGFSLTLEERLEGNHTIRVAAYADSNANGEFDRDTDRPCYDEGSRVQTDPTTVNFTSLAATDTDQPSSSRPTNSG